MRTASLASLMLLVLLQVPFAPWRKFDYSYMPTPQPVYQPAPPPAMPWQRTQIIVQPIQPALPGNYPIYQQNFYGPRPFYQQPPNRFWGW